MSFSLKLCWRDLKTLPSLLSRNPDWKRDITVFPTELSVQVAETQLHIADELDSKREIPQMPYEIAVNNKKVNKSLIAVADKKKNCVRIFDKEGKFVRKLGC